MRPPIHPDRACFTFSSVQLAIAVVLSGLQLSVAAQTQTPPGDVPAAAPGGTQVLPSVTVTAQRRREPAREVPLSADVLDGEAMERGGYQSLGDIAAQLPGVSFTQSGAGSGQSQVTMRGITTGTQVGATVSMYVDDIPFGSSSAFGGGGSNALDLGLFDLSAVEVLRGPQGTLYGAGAMGGLIKYVSNEPDTRRFGGQVTTEVSSVKDGNIGYVARGILNAPINEGVAAMRVTVYDRKTGGFVRDLNHGGDIVDGSQTQGARVAFLVTPNKDLSLRLTALSQRQKRDGSSSEDIDVATGRPVDGGISKRLFTAEPVTVNNDLASAALKADLKWAELDVISGFQRSTNDGRVDPSALYVPYLSQLGLVNPGYALDYTFHNRKFTQEVRLTSPRSRNFEWLGGVFYTDEHADRSQLLQPLNASQEPVPPLLLNAQYPSRFREMAAYGTGTYYLNPKTDVMLGVRRSHNEQALDQQFSGLFAPPPQPAAGSSESVTTWLFTARWRPAERQALYARAASGYRPGGPLPLILDPVTGQPLNKPSFRSDSLWSYEVGWKGDVIPGRVSSEVALYQIDWKDIQVFTSTAGFSGIGNAGRARSRGLEWTMRASPMEGWRISSAVNVIDAKLLEASPDLGAAAGERLPDTARLSAALQADHDFRLAGHDAYVGMTLRYTGDRLNAFSAAPGSPQYRMPAYTTIDLRAGVDIGRAKLGLYVRNLADTRGQTAADTSLSITGGPARVNLVAPRTIGLQFSMDFS